jgi:hypothetical protein
MRVMKGAARPRLLKIQLFGDTWLLDKNGRHVQQMPRAQRRDLKWLRIGSEPPVDAFVSTPERIRRTSPEDVAGAAFLTDELSLDFVDRPPLSPLDFLGQDELFLPGPAEFSTMSSAPDWVFPGYQEDQSMQNGASI